MNMRLMRALALLCLCSRACAEEGDYIVAVDAAGEVQSTHSTHGATGYGSSKAEPMSLNAILPHWPEATGRSLLLPLSCSLSLSLFCSLSLSLALSLSLSLSLCLCLSLNG